MVEAWVWVVEGEFPTILATQRWNMCLKPNDSDTEYGKQNSSLVDGWKPVRASVSDDPTPLPNNYFCLDVNYGFQMI